MTFAQHIRKRIFEHRLGENRLLVVFDPDGRYEQICSDMSSDTCTVISDVGKPLSTRMAVMRKWRELCEDQSYKSTLLIYSKERPPQTEEERMANPFSSYVAMGSRFPDGASDDYQQICLTFLPDRRTEITKLFEGSETPEIQHIDSLAGGANSHPRLEAIFGTGEVTKIITEFLVPSEATVKQLANSTDWCGEFRELTERIFGLKLNAQLTKAESLRAKLWQFLLFSEFAADLPHKLPGAVESLPRAVGSAQAIVDSLCEALRTSTKTREAYRDEANRIQEELNLEVECHGIADLGERDTFAFEEKWFLKFAVSCIKAGDHSQAQAILNKHERSLWTEEGERQLLWRILRLAVEAINAIKLGEEELKHLGPTGADLAQLYTKKLSSVDLHQRELDTAVLQLAESMDEVEPVIDIVHAQYRNFANRLQDVLLPAVQREGWPLSGMSASRDIYRDHVAPMLNNGKRVAYFLTDALRLELVFKLSENLSKTFPCEVTPVCAQLPCVTRFGMASLLPEAGETLKFEIVKNSLEPVLGDTPVGTRTNRLKAFETHKGGRVSTFEIGEFVNATKTTAKKKELKTKLENTDLLVVTSTELDALGENDEWLRQYLAEPLDKLLRAIHRAADLGFEVAVIASDHGFLWIDEMDAGTACETPSGGEWVLSKRRCYIGTGDEPPGSIRFDTAAVGIPCEQPSFVVPRSIGAYKKGSSYYHEGLSLPESLVGLMVVQLSQSTAEAAVAPQAANLDLSRKRSKVSSLILSVNLSWPGEGSLFADSTGEFEVVAFQGKTEVGRPTASELVDPTTGRVKLKPGSAIKVNIRLTNSIAEGPFKVKVLDSKTEKALDMLDLTYEPNVL